MYTRKPKLPQNKVSNAMFLFKKIQTRLTTAQTLRYNYCLGVADSWLESVLPNEAKGLDDKSPLVRTFSHPIS